MTDQGMNKLAEDLRKIDDIYLKECQQQNTDSVLTLILSELCQTNSSIRAECGSEKDVVSALRA